MIAYVSKSGSDSNYGTQESPFLTIGRGLRSKNTVSVGPGTYTESVTISNNGTTLFASSPGQTVIDGTGNTHAVLINASHVKLLGFEINNVGGLGTRSRGVSVWNTYDVNGATPGIQDITVHNCVFRNISRPLGGYATPFSVLGYGDVAAGGTATRNTTLSYCEFHQSKINWISEGINTSYVIATGNVSGFDISYCTFLATDVEDVADRIVAISLSGGYFYPAGPSRPRNVRLSNCQFVSTVPTLYALYIQASTNVDVYDCVFSGWNYGIGAFTESTFKHKCRDVWIRRCEFYDNADSAVIFGRFNNVYQPVENISVTDCVIARTTQGTIPPLCVVNASSGVGSLDCSISNCTIKSPGVCASVSGNVDVSDLLCYSDVGSGVQGVGSFAYNDVDFDRHKLVALRGTSAPVWTKDALRGG